MIDSLIVIEFVGEGRTDIGRSSDKDSLPEQGVIPILVHKLCGSPANMRARCDKLTFLERGSLHRKVLFAKQEAAMRMARGKSHALVFVIDTEGEHPSTIKKMNQANGEKHLDLPTVVGVAHPCIESWLLADVTAIKMGLKLTIDPATHEDPESLPAPCKNRSRNPKTVLAGCGSQSGQLNAAEKSAIAAKMHDMELVRTRCPKSFAPFADEVVRHIKPLFGEDPATHA